MLSPDEIRHLFVTDVETMTNAEWLTIDELADHLKLGRTKLCQMAQDGSTLVSELGNQWRFDREKIDAWMKGQRRS